MSASVKIRALLGCGLLLLLAACPTRVRETAPPAPSEPAAVRGVGTPYRIVPEESLLTIRVFRGGPLARTGHNHVVASHDLTGTVFVSQDVERSSFDIRFPVASLTVDEPGLRAEAGPEFPPDVPDSAREGTRRNMLGPALLDGESFPEIALRSTRLERVPGGLAAHAEVLIRDQVRPLVVPVRYELTAGSLVATGELAIRQTDLGLTPFSALLGALQVQDEMQVAYRITARAP